MVGKTVTECVHCHLCQENCAFLSKYGIDIGDTGKLKELAFHCFLCGRCTEVCPVDIDGRAEVLRLRQERVSGTPGQSSSEKEQIEKKYKGLIGEKREYKFRNWKHATSGSVFFPGCNFPSMYPKTNAWLEKRFAEHGIGTVYECCGKPISELGLKEDEERIISGIRSRLNDNNITEIVTACPNCRAFFGGRLGVKVVSVYTKLQELGLGEAIEGNANFYLPCPDRTERIWISEIRPFIKGNIDIIDGIQCCGLGGSAAACEPEIAKGFVEKLKAKGADDLYTYCASCTGQFHRSGLKDIKHTLPEITGTRENPDIMKSYVNRVLTRFK